MPPELVPVPSAFPATAGELLALLSAMSTNISKCYAGCTCSSEAGRAVRGFQKRQNEIEMALLFSLGQSELLSVPTNAALSTEVSELTRIHIDLYDCLIGLYREPRPPSAA